VEVSSKEDPSEDVEEAEDEEVEGEEEDSTITIVGSIKVPLIMLFHMALSFINPKTTLSLSALTWADSLSSTVEFT
jgi:hypothetical protein